MHSAQHISSNNVWHVLLYLAGAWVNIYFSLLNINWLLHLYIKHLLTHSFIHSHAHSVILYTVCSVYYLWLCNWLNRLPRIQTNKNLPHLKFTQKFRFHCVCVQLLPSFHSVCQLLHIIIYFLAYVFASTEREREKWSLTSTF